MNFFKNILGKKEMVIQSYGDFWKWFQQHERIFFDVVKKQTDIENKFFAKLSDKLAELKDGYFFLTGMYDENTVELIFTADGNANNIVFIEELVEQAPKINGWVFTPLKPATDSENFSIEMAGCKFDSNNIYFYSNESDEYPDEIDICVIHSEQTEENKKEIEIGICIFLDSYLGELNFLDTIDDLKVISQHEAKKELIPITKLKDFLMWRQKEFVEKYEYVLYEMQNDEYSLLEAELKSGSKLIAVVNTALLNWDAKASHPWIATICFRFGGINNSGMPNEDDYQRLNEIEDSMTQNLLAKDGYLYVGRQTADNEREIYFACKDYRKPSKVFYQIKKDNDNKFEVEFDIYKDKYWQSFERFKKSKTY